MPHQHMKDLTRRGYLLQKRNNGCKSRVVCLGNFEEDGQNRNAIGVLEGSGRVSVLLLVVYHVQLHGVTGERGSFEIFMSNMSYIGIFDRFMLNCSYLGIYFQVFMSNFARISNLNPL